MKFCLKQEEEWVETMENKGTKIKEVPRSIVVSFAIHWNTRFMTVPINQQHNRCSKTKFPMQNKKRTRLLSTWS
jgi:hypothetical protein